MAAPNRYQVKVDVKVGGAIVDTYVAPLGFRTATFDANTGFSLNGQHMKIWGVNMHHDLGALGAAVNYRAIERQVQILRGMGVNAIRTSHNPPAPELLDITDRLGVLVLDESFDTWTQNEDRQRLRPLFRNLGATRHPGHGQARPQSSQHHSLEHRQRGRRLDDGDRPEPEDLGSGDGQHACRDLGVQQDGRSARLRGRRPQRRQAAGRGGLQLRALRGRLRRRPLRQSHLEDPGNRDLGLRAQPRHLSHAGQHHHQGDRAIERRSTASSYDNEAAGFGDTAQNSYSYDASRAFVAGSFIWAGFDYIGEPTPYSSFPSKSSYYGAIDTAGFPKDVYYFYKSRWITDPVVHILPHWNWTAGTMVTIYVYNNCDSVELFLNNASQGSQTATASTLRLEWSVPWSSGTVRADCKRGGSVVATDQVRTAGAAARVVLSADRTTIDADGKDLVFVTGDIQDANGAIVPSASNAVSFAVSGPGQLVGVDNGNPVDTASYKGTSRNAFSGKVLAIVRSTGTAGSIAVSATSSGLTSGSVTVSAQ